MPRAAPGAREAMAVRGARAGPEGRVAPPGPVASAARMAPEAPVAVVGPVAPAVRRSAWPIMAAGAARVAPAARATIPAGHSCCSQAATAPTPWGRRRHQAMRVPPDFQTTRRLAVLAE